MVKVVFIFEVAPEKQSEYFKATAERIKPHWEARGCLSYQVWQVEGENTFIKEMHFSDLATQQKTMGVEDAESKSVISLWNSFVAGSFERKIYIQKV